MATHERIVEKGAPEAVLDRLIASLRARDTPLDGQTRPAAILWTDPKREWLPLVDLLLRRVEEYLVLGDYDPGRRTGPAVWVRCVVDRALDEPKLPDDRPPIVHLPGVARQDLRAGEECPDGLQPLVELLFRGALWRRPNGSDWTVNAFLTSRKTLGLDVAGDRATSEALLRALEEVALTPAAQLEGRRLEADDFDRMLAGDVIRDLLRWMGDPDTTRTRLGENGWHAFCNRCRDELGFSPAQEADVVAGERMAKGEGAWAAVWERFTEAPASYGDVAGLLRRSAPAGTFRWEERERWPDLNEQDEETVRRALTELPAHPHREAVAALERTHGERRTWVWARLGLAPMAEVLKPLASLAAAARRALGGTEPADVAAAYLERGWQADLGAWQAVAAAPIADEACVAAAARHLLLPWLEASARAFQAALERRPLPGNGGQPTVDADDDGCLLFVDGLRFDLAQRLAERIEGRGYRVDLDRRWAALPTVTGTGKPAVTPVAGEIEGDVLGQAFGARMRVGGKPADAPGARPADAPALRTALEARGYQILAGGGDGAPRTHPARGWLETGEFDTLGHQRGAQLARHLDAELERVAERIERVLDAGWTSVRVVTDHGWLLLPGGLPKVDLPKHLTESRWARCAVMAGEAAPDVVRAPWHWNRAQWFATPPGIACFHAYAPGWNFPKLNPADHLTDHFGLVSDFLSECWTRLRQTSRVSVLQNRVFWGGALSGRDVEAVHKTCSGLVKLLFPDPDQPVPDDDLEWIVRLALESRRRVKEQQKRCLKSEFRNTHFSFTLGVDGVEQFVSTPELHSDEAIDGDPLPPGQVWAIGPGRGGTGAGLYRIEIAAGPGSGAKVLNHPVPPAFRESVKVGEQNLYARAGELLGDRDPRAHEYTVQLRPFDADTSGAGLGLPVLVACVGGLLERSTRGGTIVVGPLNLGGSMALIPNPVAVAELAVDKQAATLLMPVSARRALNDLPDDLWTKINVEFYSDPADGVFKALLE